MIVTEMLPLNNQKYRIYLDGEKAFVLYKGEVRRFQLTPLGELSDEAYAQIMSEILLKRARRRALHLLERCDRTMYQLREKLRQGEYPEEIIEDAIRYVESFHYIDDARYARNYISIQYEKKSRRQLYLALQRKGVSKETVDEAYAKMTEELELEENDNRLIQKWIEKKNVDFNAISEKEYQKFCRFLLRKGFSYDEIAHVLREYRKP